MELLIVGAGAVGAVYGYLSSQRSPAGSARITYLVKPKHQKDLEAGIRLYHWRGKDAEPIIFRDFSLISSFSEMKEKKYDAILITLPSDKFRESGWLEGLVESSGNAKVWSLQPNAGDPELLRNKLIAHFGPGAEMRAVTGRIPIMSYLAPLPGEPFAEPGYAFYIPKVSPAIWTSLDPEAAREACDFYHAAGLPSKTAPADFVESAVPEALLRSVVAGLERCEWSFDRFTNGENIQLAAGAMREMTAIQAKRKKVADSGAGLFGKIAATPFGIRTALRIVKSIVPFDFEAFLRVHFSKVEGQMHLALDEFIADGKKMGQSTTNLVLLRGRAKRAI